jgi:hypothetical protein
MMRIATPAAVAALACVAAGTMLGGCNPRANHTGFEHQNLNLEDSQVDWIPHTYFRSPNSDSFTAFPAPSVTDTNQIARTQNPTPVTANHIHGPTNTIGLGQSYSPVGSQPKH